MEINLNKGLFFVLSACLAVTFFTRNTFRNVDDIAPELLKDPIQIETEYPEPIVFSRDGYDYSLTPLYDYEISGLIVGKMDYRVFSIDKYDSVFPGDLCMIWGPNVASRVYRDHAVKFSQDCRWCWVQWYGNVGFSMRELSNNHLLINNKYLESKFNRLLRGDQVKIKGKLVSVVAEAPGKPQSRITWHSSTNREDTGGGACEVIYVEDIQVLRKANVFSGFLFQVSLIGLGLWFLVNIIRFFKSL
ncbi:MAG: hypothetical protein PHR91_03180 [Candidatus Omnitrophica bacterium]|nr:hypothetical protein [Candidatus Omnitrophota bacterium]